MANPTPSSFVHVHVHSEYSLLDGQSHLAPLIEAAKQHGQPALALTDHGTLQGALAFAKLAKQADIHPIIGMEAYLAEKPVQEAQKGRQYTHLLLLAGNNTGYRNLMKLSTYAHTVGMGFRPRIDKEALARHSEGLIAASGCISGEIPQAILAGKTEDALSIARWHQEVFGDRFYLEVQQHGNSREQDTVNAGLFALHRETHIPMIVTNDSHYTHPDDHEAHDVLLCIQTGKTLADEKRMRFDSDQYYLKSTKEMALLFPDHPELLRNTLAIAGRCDVTDFGQTSLPTFPVAEGTTPEEMLFDLTMQGIEQRYGFLHPELYDRAAYELSILQSKGYTSYFLIVWDLMHAAREHGIRCSARGSAGGSLVAYALGITTVDPIAYHLTFERFLNPDRPSMPDIDIDFPDAFREWAVGYLQTRYGREHVVQISTVVQMGRKQALRDVGRVMNCAKEAARLARQVHDDGHADEENDAATAEETGPARQIFDMAGKLEGTIKAVGVHPAGVVLSQAPLADVVPLRRKDPKDPRSALVVDLAQTDAEREASGMIKFDILGLTYLTILENTRHAIKERHQCDINLDEIPLAGEVSGRVWAALSRGETTGLFQFESAGIRRVLRDMQPNCLQDVMAANALYRPGPIEAIPAYAAAKRANNPMYLDPRLEPLLAETYGVIVYQDQVLLIAVELAGFTWLEVDAFRKAMGKKKLEEIAKYHQKFLDGCGANGVAPDVAQAIYDQIAPFSGYGFNKAHACAYAWMAYQGAWLREAYPVEFLAACFTAENGDAERCAVFADEARRLNVPLLPLHLWKSGQQWSIEAPEDGREGLRCGLACVKGIHQEDLARWIAKRSSIHVPSTIVELVEGALRAGMSQMSLEALVKAGAADWLGSRNRTLAHIRAMWEPRKKQLARAASGQLALFGEPEQRGEDISYQEETREERLEWEQEATGIFLSGHPCEGDEVFVAANREATLQEIALREDNARVLVAGRVKSILDKTTKKGEAMAVVMLEDLTRTMPVVFFPRQYAAFQSQLQHGGLLRIEGAVSQEQGTQILVEHCRVISREQAPQEKEWPLGEAPQEEDEPILYEDPLQGEELPRDEGPTQDILDESNITSIVVISLPATRRAFSFSERGRKKREQGVFFKYIHQEIQRRRPFAKWSVPHGKNCLNR